MNKFILIGALTLTLGLSLTACKPTEKGYKSAYDAAVGKRESVMSELGVNLPEGALQQVDGPQLKEVDGIKVYVLNQHISPLETGVSLPDNYNVAIGKYKMSTNAISQSNDLKNQGLKAFPVKDTEDFYYTIAGSFPSLSEAVEFNQEYLKRKNITFVGLPNAPVIIYSPK